MRTRIAVLVAATAAALLLPALPADAAAEPWALADDDLTVTSQGYGHGIGMSQYGAKGRAEAGQTAAQILAFYYAGTTFGTATGAVRVLISKDTDQNTMVRSVAGLSLADLGDRKVYKLPYAGITRWRLVKVAGKVRVSYLTGGVWKPFRPGGKVALVGTGEFRSSTGRVSLIIGSVVTTYRGYLRLTAGRTVNVVSLEHYLKGVVPAEMPALWSAEAVKAQAIAARTYAAYERDNAPASRVGFQLYDDTRSQVYKGFGAEIPESNAAIAATTGKAVLSGGKPAFAQFSASNGGLTATNARFTYLTGGKADPFDTAYRDRTLTIGPKTRAVIEKAHPELGALQRVRVYQRGADKRVLWVQFDGTKDDDVRITGSALRGLIGLRSTYFSLA